MSNDWYDDETIKKHIRQLVEKELKELSREIPEHLAGNKFRVPPAMKEWMDNYFNEMGGKADSYYRTNIGFGHAPLIVDWVLSQDSLTMTFLTPWGDRLFILDLIK